MYECDGGEPVDCEKAFLDRHGNKWWARVLAFLWSMHDDRVIDRYYYPGEYGEALVTEQCYRCNRKRQYNTPGGP